MDIRTSVIITTWNRARLLERTLESMEHEDLRTDNVEVIVVEDGDDGGWTRTVCKKYHVLYFQRKARPDVAYYNQAALVNCGIRNARGEILVIQNAECEHITPNVIRELTEPHLLRPNLAVFAAALKLQEEDAPSNLKSPYFFCGSVRKMWLQRIRGMDEDFKGWGADDDDLASRMKAVGVKFVYRPDILVHHQYHGKSEKIGREENTQLFVDKFYKRQRGLISPIANEDRDWGIL